MKYATAVGLALGSVGFYVTWSGFGVLLYYWWIPASVVLIGACIPSLKRFGRAAFAVTTAIVVGLFVVLAGVGMLARVAQKRTLCRMLDPLFVEAKAFYDRTGAYPTNISLLASVRLMEGATIGQGRVGDNGIDVGHLNEHAATVYLKTNDCLCIVPVTRVLPISITRFYVYSRGIADPTWKWEKIVWMIGSF